MRSPSSFTRTVALVSVLAYAIPFASADTEVIIDNPELGTTITEQTTATADNIMNTAQNAVDDAVQQALQNAAAAVTAASTQAISDAQNVLIDQTCASTGSTVCFAEAAPHVRNEAIQQIEAAANNAMAILQQAGAASIQQATASGAASTQVTAGQSITSDTIIEIFQDCTIQTGVCVQRAMPEVLNHAQQLIAASAINALDVAQQAEGGAVQDIAAELAAEVQVAAEQSIDAQAFFRLSQICAVDIGMCIQRTLPLMRTAVEQVIDAQADNIASLLQDGAEVQNAATDTTTLTTIDALQNTQTDMSSELFRNCVVRQGLCLQVSGDGTPVFLFSDGETQTTGTYVGTLDETPLQTDYSRASVGAVASGICGGEQTCPMVQQLLFWLFGPEPASVPTVTRSSTRSNNTETSNRGHQTNVLGASLEFLALNMPQQSIPPPAFGGGEEAATSEQRSMICAMRKALVRERHSGDAWVWTTERLAGKTGLSYDAVSVLLHDDGVCPQILAQSMQKTFIPSMFPVTETGPVSSNEFWNACIRGEQMTLEDIRSNPDRNEDGLPRTCASYHTQDSWYHPDLRVHFTWDPETGRLALPEGYVPQMQQS
jgi:hypothetical protein